MLKFKNTKKFRKVWGQVNNFDRISLGTMCKT